VPTHACRRPPLATSDHRLRSEAVRWQVFGLAGTTGCTHPITY